MKTAIRVLVCAAAAVLLLSLAPAAHASPSDGFEILDYDVHTVIDTHNVYHITETIHVNFYEEKHGIYRTIPVDTEMTRTSADGEEYTTKVASWVTDVQVDGDPFTVGSEYNGVYIKIGDPNVTLTGEHTYHVTYNLHFGNDGVDAFDEVYYNIIGVDWTTMTDKLTFSVTLPQAFEADTLGFSVGYRGSTGYALEDIAYSVKNRTISGEVLRPLNSYEGVTMRLELPDGYFDVPPVEQPDWIMMGVFGFLALAGIALFLIFGIDKKPVQTVEFYAPEGMTPTEVGYINDGYADSRDIVALLIYWAGKGYLTIDPFGSGYMLTRRKDLDADTKDYEQLMFSALFMLGNAVSTDSLKYKFYSVIMQIISMVKKHFSAPENRLYTHASMRLKPLLSFLSVVPMMTALVVTLSRTEMGIGFALSMGLMLGLMSMAPLYWVISVMRRWRSKTKKSRTVQLTVASCLFGGVIAAFVAVTSGLAYEPLLPWAAVLGTLLLALCAVFISKRTAKGTEWTGKIWGFKNFIELAERDRLILLVEQNPKYFYDILPYAYVLNITDKWAKNFESISVPPPDWYGGSVSDFTPLLFMTSITGAMNSIQTTMVSSPSSSGSSSGGGSSGGGGGGGGGGSW